MKLKKIEVEGKYLKAYYKRPYFGNLEQKLFDLHIQFYDDYEAFLGLHFTEDKKYVVATFVLRNMEDMGTVE